MNTTIESDYDYPNAEAKPIKPSKPSKPSFFPPSSNTLGRRNSSTTNWEDGNSWQTHQIRTTSSVSSFPTSSSSWSSRSNEKENNNNNNNIGNMYYDLHFGSAQQPQPQPPTIIGVRLKPDAASAPATISKDSNTNPKMNHQMNYQPRSMQTTTTATAATVPVITLNTVVELSKDSTSRPSSISHYYDIPKNIPVNSRFVSSTSSFPVNTNTNTKPLMTTDNNNNFGTKIKPIIPGKSSKVLSKMSTYSTTTSSSNQSSNLFGTLGKSNTSKPLPPLPPTSNSSSANLHQQLYSSPLNVPVVNKKNSQQQQSQQLYSSPLNVPVIKSNNNNDDDDESLYYSLSLNIPTSSTPTTTANRSSTKSPNDLFYSNIPVLPMKMAKTNVDQRDQQHYVKPTTATTATTYPVSSSSKTLEVANVAVSSSSTQPPLSSMYRQVPVPGSSSSSRSFGDTAAAAAAAAAVVYNYNDDDEDDEGDYEYDYVCLESKSKLDNEDEEVKKQLNSARLQNKFESLALNSAASNILCDLPTLEQSLARCTLDTAPPRKREQVLQTYRRFVLVVKQNFQCWIDLCLEIVHHHHPPDVFINFTKHIILSGQNLLLVIKSFNRHCGRSVGNTAHFADTFCAHLRTLVLKTKKAATDYPLNGRAIEEMVNAIKCASTFAAKLSFDYNTTTTTATINNDNNNDNHTSTAC